MDQGITRNLGNSPRLDPIRSIIYSSRATGGLLGSPPLAPDEDELAGPVATTVAPTVPGPGPGTSTGLIGPVDPDNPDGDEVSGAYLSLARAESLLDSLAKSGPWEPMTGYQDQAPGPLASASGAVKGPREIYRELMDEYLSGLGIRPGRASVLGRARQFAHEFARAALEGDKYAPPEERLYNRALEEFKAVAPVVQRGLATEASVYRAGLAHQARIEALRQREAQALRENNVRAAGAYARIAREQERLLMHSLRAREIASRIGLDQARAERIAQEIQNAKATRGLGGEAGLVLALSEMPEQEQEKVLDALRRAKEAGRDPLRALKYAQSGDRARGPFTPIRDPSGDIIAFYSPADNRVVPTPYPITDRPDQDQKSIDRANLVTVLSNLSKVRGLNEQYVEAKSKYPAGAVRGLWSTLASRYGLGDDFDTSVSQMNTILKHATRTMIYLMSGKAVSEREAQDFEAIMPAMTIGQKDFEMKLALMLATIATFAQVRFRKPISQILEEEARISPQLAPEIGRIAQEFARAQALSGNIYANWKRIAPRFAEAYKDYLLRPETALLPGPEQGPRKTGADRVREALERFKSSLGTK